MLQSFCALLQSDLPERCHLLEVGGQPCGHPPKRMLGSPMAHWLLKEASWKSAAWRPLDGHILQDQGTSKSAQRAKVHAARLAICCSLKEGHKIVRIYSDS
jgi:hypothetical protein